MAELVDIVKIPYLNPLRFHREDEKFACELIPSFERKVSYIQKFQQTDKLMFQVLLYKTKWNAVSYKVYDLDGNQVLSSPGRIAGSYGTYDVWVPRDVDNITSLDAGRYIIVVSTTIIIGEDNHIIPFVSEPFEIVDYELEDSILIEYSHDGNEFDMAFYPNPVTQLYYQLRVEGGVSSDNVSMASKDQFYVDQIHDVVMLNSKPFNVYKFTFGNSRGIPNWMADKINRILSLAYVELDGTPFVKNDGAKFEAVREKGYPMAGWNIELVPAKQRFSITEGVANQLGDYNIDYNEDYY